jgi:AcrR family transcriptional regulator
VPHHRRSGEGHLETGLARATTKKIAKAARCAEGTLYNHFHDRMRIFAAVFAKHLPRAVSAFTTLEAQVGKGNLIDNVAAALFTVSKFLDAVVPIFAWCTRGPHPTLAKAFRATWSELGFGPHHFVTRMTSFIRREQECGRIPPGIRAEAVSEMLLGFLFYSSFMANLLKASEETAYERRLYQIVRASLALADQGAFARLRRNTPATRASAGGNRRGQCRVPFATPTSGPPLVRRGSSLASGKAGNQHGEYAG